MTSGARIRDILTPLLACVASGLILFEFAGNSTRGYIGSTSLFYWWGFQWIDPESETQHGLLILGISVWLLWRNLRSEPPGNGGPAIARGTTAMAIGILLHVLGYVAQQARLSILGLLFFIWGVIAFGGGRRWSRAAVFPVAFLVFAIPLNALDSAGFWLRMWVISASTHIAHLLGIPVVANGTQLLSPDGRYDYDVAAACSGVRSLIALAALSLLLGYLRLGRWWLRASAFLASFPLIYAANVIRIVAIIVAAQIGGQRWGDWVHGIMGFAVFAIVLGGIYLIVEWANALEGSRPRVALKPPVALARPPEYGARAGNSAAVAIVVLALGACVFLVHLSRIPARQRTGVAVAPGGRDPVELPTFIGVDWIGRRTPVTEIERRVLPPDTGYSRKTYVYLANPSQQAFLSIVLSGSDRTSIHRPELCLVAQGWTILGSVPHSFEFPDRTADFPATVLRISREITTPQGRKSIPQLVAYYFVGDDRIVATHWQRIASDAWNRLAHGRADRWAYVAIQTGASDGEQAALARIQAILDGTLPTFQLIGAKQT